MLNVFMRFPKGLAKALTLSYDDGVIQDKRLIEIMGRHGIKGTFNLNSGLFAQEGTFTEEQTHRRLTAAECRALYTPGKYEVAIHGLTHPFLEQLSGGMLCSEIVDDKRNLERLFGQIIRGMAYPFGTYNDEVVNALALSGIAYARTTYSTESFDIPEDWLRLDPTCHHNDDNLKELTDKFINYKPKQYSQRPWMFYLWGHSFEFDNNNNWGLIEKFAETTGGRDDIWYATNIEIYDYVKAYKSLIFSTDGKLVKNPSAVDVYALINNDIAEIKAGAVVAL